MNHNAAGFGENGSFCIEQGLCTSRTAVCGVRNVGVAI